MGLNIARAGFRDFESLTKLFALCNVEHCEMRADIYRRVDAPVPKLKFMLGVAAGKLGIEPVTILMAEQGRLKVGAVYVESNSRSALSWSRFEKEAVVDNVVVLPEFRRQGIGTELLKAACDWAAETGHRHISAEILELNGPSRTLFAKAGFEVDKVKVGLHLKK